MGVLRSPRGLIIDLITPLNIGGDIDGRGLGKQLDRVLPYVHALLLASPYMGEGNHLKPTQREELLEKVNKPNSNLIIKYSTIATAIQGDGKVKSVRLKNNSE